MEVVFVTFRLKQLKATGGTNKHFKYNDTQFYDLDKKYKESVIFSLKMPYSDIMKHKFLFARKWLYIMSH